MESNTPEVPVEDPRVWYLRGPYFQYVENVKLLAKRAGLIIVDPAATEGRNFAVEGPAVTIKPEYANLGAPVDHVAPPRKPATLAEAIAQLALVETKAAPAPAAAPVALEPTVPAPVVLLGSDKFEQSTYEIGNGAPDVQLGAIVAAAHARSSKTADEWNKLKPAARNKLMTAELEAMRSDAAVALAKSLTP